MTPNSQASEDCLELANSKTFKIQLQLANLVTSARVFAAAANGIADAVRGIPPIADPATPGALEIVGD